MLNSKVNFNSPKSARELLKDPGFLRRINKDDGAMGYPLIRLAQDIPQTDNGRLSKSLNDEQKEVIYEYIRAGADPNVRDDFKGNTPLMWAIANAKVENALHFIDHPDVDIGITDDDLKTPLHLAVLKGYYHMDDDPINKSQKQVGYAIEALIARGVQDRRGVINKQDKFGNTPLHYSVLHRDLATIRKLVHHGADCCIINNDGEKPIDMLDVDYDKARNLIDYKARPFSLDQHCTWASQNNLKFLRGFLTREEAKKNAAQPGERKTINSTPAGNVMEAKLRELSINEPIGHSSVDGSKNK